MRQGQSYGRLLVIFLMVMLAGCASSPDSSFGPLPTGSPAPATPAGDYAFVRNGDIWVRLGLGTAHAATNLRLNYGTATWGDLTWSPDHAWLAFVLRSPGIAPGQTTANPDQGTGTLFAVQIASLRLERLLPATATLTVPLVGRHLAWRDAHTILFTTGGNVDQIAVDGNRAFGALTGPQHVWEIAARDGALWYSTVTQVNATGLGQAELHQFDLSTEHDTTLARLGPAQLPPQPCDLVCSPDSATPYAPYAWDVSADGKQTVFQSAISYVTANPTPLPTGTAAPGTTPITAAPAPGGFYLRSVASNAPALRLFASISVVPAGVRLRFAPDGQRIALTLDLPGPLPFGPYVQGLTDAQPTLLGPLQPEGNFTVSAATWLPDGSGLTLGTVPAEGTAGTPTAATFYRNGQQALTEQNADEFVWA